MRSTHNAEVRFSAVLSRKLAVANRLYFITSGIVDILQLRTFFCEIFSYEYEDVFWDVAPCDLVTIDRRFTGAYGGGKRL